MCVLCMRACVCVFDVFWQAFGVQGLSEEERYEAARRKVPLPLFRSLSLSVCLFLSLSFSVSRARASVVCLSLSASLFKLQDLSDKERYKAAWEMVFLSLYIKSLDPSLPRSHDRNLTPSLSLFQ